MARATPFGLLWGWVGVCLSASLGWGQEREGQWSRGQQNAPVPSWMSPVRWTDQAGMEIWSSEIRPWESGQGLLVTVVFRPQPGGFVRAIWRSPSESVTLSADLTEGNPPCHQRSLFLDASRLAAAGQIWLEAKGSTLEKVRLEWVDGIGWGPPEHRGFVRTGSGRIFRAGDLYGDAFRPEAPENTPEVVETLLQPGPIPIHERPVRLRVPLAETAEYARLEFWSAGLAANETVLFSLNEGPFEELFPEVPRLDDPGYLYDRDKGRVDLAGWRHVVRFLPGQLLRKGVNTLWLGSGGSPEAGEVVLRDLRLQTVFAPKAAPTPLPASEPPSSSPEPVPVPPEANAGLSFRSEGVTLRP